MKWEKGQSGNPAGRKPKTDHGIASALRRRILASAPEIIDGLIESAKQGDVSAGRSLLATCVPALKPIELSTPLPIPPDASLAEQGRTVVLALAAGKLPPTPAAMLLQGLATLARLIELDELERRIRVLEEQRNAIP